MADTKDQLGGDTGAEAATQSCSRSYAVLGRGKVRNGNGRCGRGLVLSDEVSPLADHAMPLVSRIWRTARVFDELQGWRFSVLSLGGVPGMFPKCCSLGYVERSEAACSELPRVETGLHSVAQ